KQMFQKYIHDNAKGDDIPERSQGGNAPDLRLHIRCADNAGAYEQRHDPQAHDNILDHPSQKPGKLRRSMQIQVHLCLSLQIALHSIRDKYRNVQRSLHCPVQRLSAAFQLLLPVGISDDVLFDPACRDLHHVDLRSNICQHPFHVGQSPGQHGEPVGHDDAVLLHDLHEIHHDLRHIDLSHFHCAVFCQKTADILVETAWIRVLLKLSQSHHCFLYKPHVVHRHTPDGQGNILPVPLSEASHHPHV